MRLIDIEPLIDECDELVSIEWNHKVAPPSWADAEEEFKQRLLDQPVIDPESLRPQGEWKDIYGGKYANRRFACTNCGEYALYTFKVDALGHENVVQALSKSCPNCGARMKGV